MTHPLALWLAVLTGVDAGPVDYAREVKPLLAAHCVACHGATRPRGGLRLDTAVAAIKGGSGGPAVVPGAPDDSPLIESITAADPGVRMPLKRPALTAAQVATLRAWVAQGAKHPIDETPSPGPAVHWAFVPPVRPKVPSLADPAWAVNPIDAFIRAPLDRDHIAPSPEADRVTLLRRLSLDLVGVPPTPEEYAAFAADTRPDAYERQVDRLLASPRFGERWARPWLDLARYADSNGYSIDAPRTIWKFRDWVIHALNRDLPFDRFVADQLAGDLKPSASWDDLTATGFHRNTPINQEGGIDLEQFRVESIVDRVNTTGTAFLGLTIGCAQCHDHKYDPVVQREYYRLFAFFNSVDEPEFEFATPELKAQQKAVRQEITAFHEKLKKDRPDVGPKELAWEQSLSPAYKQALPPELKDAFDRAIDKRLATQWQGLTELFLAQSSEFRDEYAKLAALRAREPKFVTTMIVRERAKPRETHVLQGGDFTRPADAVEPGVPQVLPAVHARKPGRPDRLDLAAWLTDPGHPLTARVTVNRLWQAYFGRGIVETENDFGTQGTPPSHPELLDWLATELVAQKWSLKALHRTIVLSRTYRQSSRRRPDLERLDPDNRRLARQSRLRLEAELIRDAALSASGLLADKLGGPSVYPPQPDGVTAQGQVKRPWVVSQGLDRYRRGLYTFTWRATPYHAANVFDAPNAAQACTRRPRSNTPLQALTLLNDPAFVECAGALADRLIRERSTDPARVEWAYRLALGRSPTDREARTVLALLGADRAEGAGDREAWSTAARVLLNLDEFLTRE